MDVQRIFDIALSSNTYTDVSNWPDSSYCMCDALLILKKNNRITQEEYETAVKEIREFIADLGYSSSYITLREILEDHGFNPTIANTGAIYKNWKARKEYPWIAYVIGKDELPDGIS